MATVAIGDVGPSLIAVGNGPLLRAPARVARSPRHEPLSGDAARLLFRHCYTVVLNVRHSCLGESKGLSFSESKLPDEFLFNRVDFETLGAIEGGHEKFAFVVAHLLDIRKGEPAY